MEVKFLYFEEEELRRLQKIGYELNRKQIEQDKARARKYWYRHLPKRFLKFLVKILMS